jgi:hypothetical protein
MEKNTTSTQIMKTPMQTTKTPISDRCLVHGTRASEWNEYVPIDVAREIETDAVTIKSKLAEMKSQIAPDSGIQCSVDILRTWARSKDAFAHRAEADATEARRECNREDFRAEAVQLRTEAAALRLLIILLNTQGEAQPLAGNL